MPYGRKNQNGLPQAQGLYDPAFEHDSCGVGFYVDMKGRKSHEIVDGALQICLHLEHRGACGCEANTGDGAGIFTQIPHKFFVKACREAGFEIPEAGSYGVGFVFLPREPEIRRQCEAIIESVIHGEGQKLLGWRDVPVNREGLGQTALACEPVMRQVFVGRGPGLEDTLAFERKLYVIRRYSWNQVHGQKLTDHESFYFTSFSSRTICYKGMLTPDQLATYFPDLLDPDYESALALTHSRFSTNTFPSWPRAHPYRYMSHNGEINTLRGNINWMRARQALIQSEVFGDELRKIVPIIDEQGSDSGMFDNCLEFLVLAGRSLPHAVMMMIPEPWENHENMSEDRRAFYQYHATIMEAWDGPASIAFTDGTYIGAVLDRNGLRPSRYYVTKDHKVIMASEVGVLPVEPENIILKGRLQPGRMFLVDTTKGRIVEDEEIKSEIAREHPYDAWLKDNMVHINELPEPGWVNGVEHSTVLQRQRAFGYTYEDLRFLLEPMAQTAVEPVGSMGNDAPLAVLSDRSQLLYSYFKQLFAQVTNPAIDSIREAIITASVTFLGSEGDLTRPTPDSCRQLMLDRPIIDNRELEKIRNVPVDCFQSTTLPILFDVNGGERSLERAMESLSQQADEAVAKGVNLLVLSDRQINRDNAPIPALLAVAGLHHHLIRQGTRTRVSIVLESGEPREVHHFSVLIGFGADAINPYLAFESLYDMAEAKDIDIDFDTACSNYIKAAVKGVIKTMSKMGISTVASYRGAQIFEAIGLNSPLVHRYFTGTASRVEGIGIQEIQTEVRQRHDRAFPDRELGLVELDSGGLYQWRHDGEHHLFNPQTIHMLQLASRTNNIEVYRKYSELVNNQAEKLCTLRGMMDFKFAENPIPIEEVEPVEEIVKRFKTGAMSFGSISKEAHESLAIAMNRLGGKSNTGEGGEDPDRFTPDPNGDSRCSAIKQVASGRFGVTSHYLVNSREIQIKIAQGAKPGEGGQLPGHKVLPAIAKVRGTTPGVGLISPPPHHDIYSIEDLAELIHDLKNANAQARINVKLVAEIGVGTVAAGVAKGHADVILISGYDGGTGASPRSSIIHAGCPWELGVAETNQTLLLNNLRSRVVIETDGQLKTGRDVIVACLLGAEEFGFASAPLVALGCLMMRVCHKNTCPVGVATQNEQLRKKFMGSPDHVVHFLRFVAGEVREYMARLGFRTINEMVGRVDRLETRTAIQHWKAKGLDFSRIFYRPEVGSDVGTYCQISQDHGLEKALDNTTLMELCRPAIEKMEKVRAELSIKNINRVVGTIVGSEISRRYGAEGLPEDTIHLKFTGSAGQSFGAFAPKGMSLELEGDSNDYIGKGLSGGRIVVYPPRHAGFVPEDNIIVGNVAFYGATSGEAYIYGMAGERFCVRNSGLRAVIEAVGDHGCEYMTGGCVVILGETGRNFAAGMSGGIAYVMDEHGEFNGRLNHQMVNLYRLSECTPQEIAEVQEMIERHVQFTGSRRGREILDHWNEWMPRFAKVLPRDYERMLNAFKRMEAAGLKGEEAVMAAFEENSRDLARVGGN